MDLRQLQAFMAVKELLSFTKAAERLGYAQSSVTAQIQQLEHELGVRLFERIGKSIALTDTGARLAPYASEMLSLSRTMKAVAVDDGAPAGTLIIGTSESLGISRLPAILSDYKRLYPGVDIGMRLLGWPELVPCLSRNEVDVAFVIGTGIKTEQTAEIAALPERVHVLAAPGHPLTLRDTVTERDFENEPLLLTGRGCTYARVFLERLGRQHIIPKIALETDNVQVIKQAALSGLGLCVLPAVAVVSELTEGKLVPLMYDTSSFGMVSQLLIHRDKWLSPALRAFLDTAVRLLA